MRKAVACFGFAGRQPSRLNPNLHLPVPFLRPIIRLTNIFLILVLGLLAGLVASRPFPAAAQVAADDNIAKEQIDFEEGVRIALRQSPHFLKSALEIDLKRMDETDSRYGLIPTISFRTRYYVSRPNSNNVTVINSSTGPPVVVNQSAVLPQAYSLEFFSDTYNPLEAYFTLQARKLMTQMAIYFHMQTISQGIQRLGNMFLDLQALKRLADYQDGLIDQARKNLEYTENRATLGTVTSLEIKVAKQELALARDEKARIESSRQKAMQQLGSFLGIKAASRLSLDLHDVRRQVLGDFTPETATLEQAKAKSWDLKIQKLKEKLQEYNITVAKTRVLPSFFAGMQTPDPLSLTPSGGRDFFFSIGLQVPVWDGFRRFRDVSRQKAILKQVGADKNTKETELGDEWETVQSDMRDAASALKLAQSQEELARLKERQTEIRYQSGGIQLPAYLEGRKAVLEAQKATAMKTMSYQAAVLKLRLISGDLGQSYVNQSSWQD